VQAQQALQTRQVDHNLNELPPDLHTSMAHCLLLASAHGAVPPLHEAQFTELICQIPTSNEPLVF